MAKKKISTPGILIAIGGAEDKFEEKYILNRFFEFSGGKKACIAILPSASQDERTGPAYHSIFSDFGAKTVDILPIFHHDDAYDETAVKTLEQATGIFLTGGDQNKITAVLSKTPAFEAIQKAHLKGAVIGGTSAGAAALSDPMIGGGSRGSLARSGMAKIAPGLGLAKSLIVDQHFHQRERLGRLMYAVMLNSHLVGVGVDEDTAAVIHPNEQIEVIGRGTVTIVDARKVQMFNPAGVPDKSPLVFSNIVLHTLTHGSRFSLKTSSLILERRSRGD
ncbi:MAG: cyanophycinase [Acidobacteria bacterium]|nr:cyanophycinase [Acidobacteriota bacterium]